MKLLDIRSEQSISDPGLPGEEEIKKMIPAEDGLIYCNKLFYIERTLKELSFEERKTKRAEPEPPVWDTFWKWLSIVIPLGGSNWKRR